MSFSSVALERATTLYVATAATTTAASVAAPDSTSYDFVLKVLVATGAAAIAYLLRELQRERIKRETAEKQYLQTALELARNGRNSDHQHQEKEDKNGNL